ncbi:MAG TPA: methyltransferase domain-containing protein [Conexibacter sp.]|jgi:trans-aconitate 2-methyltransferase
MAPRDWNADSYHQVSTPHQDWGRAVIGRLELSGDETVLDLGCGTGRITRALLEQLPDGRVIAVDGSASMAERARAELPADRVEVIHADLLELAIPEPADAAISTATFHWIADHDRLFANVHAALRPGAQFVVQCGGKGNVDAVLAAITQVTAQREPFGALAGWPGPWNYATPEQTRERLERAGFDVADCWLNDAPVAVEQPFEFFKTVILGAHLDRLPAEQHDAFTAAVVAHAPQVVDYVRLNWVARRR